MNVKTNKRTKIIDHSIDFELRTGLKLVLQGNSLPNSSSAMARHGGVHI